ncbi:MAG: phosphoribosylformylglycinamidine synthase subunit PurS [Candidatus Taylorbacteria bacterium]|nr:phosphoribosylformylglycinamidine synthase subunit PurS [Candidatus Taylorbacteria bacterium]
MKIQVTILTRRQTLNPADKAVKDALRQMGHGNIESLRLGRFLEFEVDASRTPEQWEALIDVACKDGKTNLANPVLEEWKIKVCP